MRKIAILLAIVLCYQCTPKKKPLTAQEIADKAISVSGGSLHKTKMVSFDFRDKHYTSQPENGKKVLTRTFVADSVTILDVKRGNAFQRTLNDSVISLPDTLVSKYANAVNSVHYFARLPFGLNDPAVHKTLMDTVSIKDKNYYQLEITFDQENGGKDFDDTYYYWFNAQTFKLDYLAYKFNVDGGGIRFREAYNERYLEGIRFVDYNNYKPQAPDSDFQTVAGQFESGNLELLSKIELKNIKVE